MGDGEFAALFLLTAPFIALIPAFIAQSKGRSFLGFYVYGFFFWLIALIHSLVMEPAKTRRPNFEHTTSLSNNASAGDMPKTRDLSSDAYKLYLAKKYSIERNDVFEKFVCNERLFSTLDEALIHADSLEEHADLKPQVEVESVEQAMDILVSAGFEFRNNPTAHTKKFFVIFPDGGDAWFAPDRLIALAQRQARGSDSQNAT